MRYAKNRAVPRENILIEITVELGERSYPIRIGSGLLRSQKLAEVLVGTQALVISNETIAPIYLQTVIDNFLESGVKADSLILPDGERFKNLETLNKIFDRLIELRHNRTTTLVALGGGVVGDMTGFAAACYQRGVNFVQLPTTLLAQVDSSVGGKTGVNHAAGKNMIGAFCQPRAVIIDTDMLQTLPDREYAAGMAEVIKYGLIADPGFLDWLEQNMSGLMRRDSELIARAIAVSCEIKARVVATDETEQGIRAILNLGHTFGHAIEAYQHYEDWLHGEAVGAGMVLAAELSMRMGNITEQDYLRAKGIIAAAGLPTKPPEGMVRQDFQQLMGLDKKVLDGRLRLVLLKSLGEAMVTAEFPMTELEAVLPD